MGVLISLPYGQGEIRFQIEEERLKGILHSGVNTYPREYSQEELVKKALHSPIGTPSLRDLVKGNDEIVIISSDHTRPLPSKVTMPLILDEIRRGNREANISILIATGFHRATTQEEILQRFGDTIVKKERIIVHDSRSYEMTDLGLLPSGGKLLLNTLALKAQLLLAEGFIEPHFFAGFSGGRKSILPGIASQETVMANHCATFIDHPSARTGNLHHNPIHEDMIAATKKANLAFILNVVLDSQQEIIQAFAGDPFLAHEEGCAFVSKLAGVEALPAPIVITTNGGYPLDQNIYQAVKGISAAQATCVQGGVIICVACCIDGHGGEEFFETFARASNPRKILEEIRSRKPHETVSDQWESQILARILAKHRVIMVTDAPKDMVEAMMMEWAPDIETALFMASKDAPGDKITVIPDGVGVILRGDANQQESGGDKDYQRSLLGPPS